MRLVCSRVVVLSSDNFHHFLTLTRIILNVLSCRHLEYSAGSTRRSLDPKGKRDDLMEITSPARLFLIRLYWLQMEQTRKMLVDGVPRTEPSRY
ncbi:uncharacterized protein YALI1_B01275g [Yarrowia lipolytica]|uniref:Uncharacterized protein n=1 Tax=Yarrowia lipolytica TaxID=4952 RepID=A0A1D8N5Y5_YARLL|nr:hypothetical protein YALI1_B01275g [Yarrowia lipolytica]